VPPRLPSTPGAASRWRPKYASRSVFGS
jgi:hypothetical protein